MPLTSEVLCPNVAKTPKKTPICEVWCLLCVQRNQCCHQYWKFPYRKIIPEVMRTFKFCLFRKISLSYNWKWPLSWQRPHSVLFLKGPLCTKSKIANLWMWVGFVFVFNIINGKQREVFYHVVMTFVMVTHLNNHCVYMAKR